MDKEEFRQFITVEVDDEALQRFRATADGALLGADFVERYKDEYPWRIGETYKLRQLEGVSITFVGTFHSENEVYNTIILAGRRYLQEVADKLGVAHQVFVKIDDSQHAAAVIAALDAELPTRFPFKTTTRDQRSFLSASVEDLRDLIDLSYLVMLVTLAVMLVAVANTVSMATRDRLQEFGILRSLGFKRGNVIGLVVGESVAITLAGGLLGLLVVFCMLNLRPSYIGLRGINMLIHLTPGVAALALCITVLIGALGGLLPAIGVGRRKIVTALRNVE